MDDSGCQQQAKEPDDKENDRPSSSTRKKISNSSSNRSSQQKSKAAGGKSVAVDTEAPTATGQRKNVLELGLADDNGLRMLMSNMNSGSSSQKQSKAQQVQLEKQQINEHKMRSTKLLEAEKPKKDAEHQQFLLISSNKDPSTILLSRVSRRALMGSVGSVGDFYNINTDSLLVPDQLNFHIREAYKYKTEPAQGNNTARCTIGRSTADLDRLFEQLGVGAEQKASIIVGLTSVKGYGGILNMKPAEVGDDSCQFTIFQRIETKKVSVNLSDPEMAQLLLNPARIGQFKGATHIVQAIHYGCVVASVFTIGPGRKEFVDLDRVQQIIYKYVNDDYHNKAEWAYLKSVQDHLWVKVHANEPFPAILDPTPDLIKLLQKIQKKTLLANLKSRVGPPSPFEHPLAYELLPLAQLVQPTFLEAIGTSSSNKSDTELAANQKLVDDCVKKWQAAGQEMHRILELFQRIRQFNYCLPASTFTQLSDLVTQLGTQFEELKAGCSQLVTHIRCGIKNNKKRRPSETAQFDRKVQAFLEAVKTLETGIQQQEWRLQNVLWLKERDVPFLGRNKQMVLSQELDAITRSNTSNSPGICYILFYFEEGNDPAATAGHWQLFRKLIAAGEKGIFVDADLIGEDLQQNLRGICLARFRDGVQQSFPGNGRQHREDYFWEHNRKLNTCIARLQKGTSIVPGGGSLLAPGTTLVPLNIPCPKGNCPTNEDYNWECDECGKAIMFDTNTTLEGVDFFYCACGRALAFEFEFRCKHAEQHGEQFATYPLQSLVSQLRKLCTGGEKSGSTT